MQKISIAIAFIGIIAIAIGGYAMLTRDQQPDNLILGSATTSKPQHETVGRAQPGTSTNRSHISKDEMLSGVRKNVTATIETSKGDVEVILYGNLFPRTVSNFVNLARADFYDGLTFHRVIDGFMIQGGDPTGTGRGGPGYTFADELKPQSEPAKEGYTRGTLAMANSGPDTNGSQFFIMHRDRPLPYRYTIFGDVTDGMDTVDAIATVETDGKDKPLSEVIIEDVIINK